MALFTLNALLLSVSLASAACYDINSQLVTNPDAVPCNNVQGAISMCCDTNRGPSSPYTPDTCLPNGLCKSVFTNTTTGKPDTNYWREFCSDVGWNKQSCLTNICSSSSNVDSNGNAEMTPCDGTSSSEKWCCGTHNTDCCGTGQEIVLAASLGISSTSSTTSSSTSTPSQSSQTHTSSSSTSSPTASSSPSGLSTGAKAGIGIGSVGLAVLIVGTVFLFMFLKKKSGPHTTEVASPIPQEAYSYHDERKIELQSMPHSQPELYEVPGRNVQSQNMHGNNTWGGNTLHGLHGAPRGELP